MNSLHRGRWKFKRLHTNVLNKVETAVKVKYLEKSNSAEVGGKAGQPLLTKGASLIVFRLLLGISINQELMIRKSFRANSE